MMECDKVFGFLLNDMAKENTIECAMGEIYKQKWDVALLWVCWGGKRCILCNFLIFFLFFVVLFYCFGRHMVAYIANITARVCLMF